MTRDVPDEVLAAVRSIPHPRDHCCDTCRKQQDDQNNRDAWAVIRSGQKEAP